jgi:NADH dehydrogenase FAD-containing subunit
VRARVLVAGLGDTGVLTAVRLSRHVDVVGVSSKPGLVSGQELGRRLARPEAWSRDYRIGFDRFRGLRRVRTVHGTLTGLDLDGRAVTVRLPDGREAAEPYDVLVVSTGVTNGFWREPSLQSGAEVDDGLRAAHGRLSSAGSVAVIGGGAAAVGTAANLAARWPHKVVDLYFPGDRALPHHHGRVWRAVRRRLTAYGVGLYPGHRAIVPGDFACDRITDDPVTWSTGQEPVTADAVVWAIGKVRPNTGWLPADLLDEDGFVRVGPTLQVPGHPEVFAVGDVAASDPLRSTARNRADRLVARNVRAHLAGRALRAFRAPRRRWGSVLGRQHDGLQVFGPTGHAVRFPARFVDAVLMPVITHGVIYRGVRRDASSGNPEVTR